MNLSSTTRPQRLETLLVAHRGEPSRFPENSLCGFRAALQAGARYVETDIQLTADGVTVLSHDSNLLRMTGQDKIIPRTPFTQLQALPANEPKRYGSRFTELRITTLDEFVCLLMEWPGVHAFIEVKEQSFSHFGATMVYRIVEQIGPIAARCTLISSSSQVLDLVSTIGSRPFGWVLPAWGDTIRTEAERLRPDILFVNHKRLPGASQPLWPGEWRWAVYTINRVQDIARFIRRGFHLLETNNISTLLATGPMPDPQAPAEESL